MTDQLTLLESELEYVRSVNCKYLPDYGFASKDEIIESIQGEIDIIQKKVRLTAYEYTDDELEFELTQLCLSQGISRFC